jgi:anti-anti-sigma factor
VNLRLDGQEPAIPRPFTVRISPHGDAVLAVATGELDLVASEAFRDQLADELAQHAVVLDLSGVTFMDSTGLRTLIAAAKNGDGKLTIRPDLSPPVERLLEISGVRESLPFAG